MSGADGAASPEGGAAPAVPAPVAPADQARQRPARGPLLGLVAALAVGGYAIDRLTKHLALTRLDPQNPPSYFGGLLKLRLISNPGAAFSMGASSTVVLSLLAIAALAAVLVLAVPRVRTWVGAIACGLALAGIAGNLTDRLIRPPGVLRGEVVDFFSLPHFAIFNVADICITLTAALLLVASLVRREEPGATKHARTPA